MGQLFLLLVNPGKPNNLGPILRCASAFGIQTIVAIGSAKCSVEGSHGASKHVEIIAFPTGEQAVAYLRDSLHCTHRVGMMGGLAVADSDLLSNMATFQVPVITTSAGHDECVALPQQEHELKDGLSPDPSSLSCVRNGEDPPRHSLPVHQAFRRYQGGENVCVVVSKERDGGLPTRLARFCTDFVHVPYPCVAPLSRCLLDTPSCLSIVLHEIRRHCQAGDTAQEERPFQGHKYNVTLPRERHNSNTIVQESKRAQRKQQRDGMSRDNDDACDLVGLVGLGFAKDNGDY